MIQRFEQFLQNVETWAHPAYTLFLGLREQLLGELLLIDNLKPSRGSIIASVISVVNSSHARFGSGRTIRHRSSYIPVPPISAHLSYRTVTVERSFSGAA
jgi:hypothetical protein